MGGVGSGSWYRWDKKLTLNETNRIDIRFMRKKGMLETGASGTLSWKRRNEPSGNINFTCFKDFLILSFQRRRNEGKWELVKQQIYFDTTSCHYGGTRKWFLCPSCNSRVGILSGKGKLFLCRHCCGLAYSSQNEGQLDRLINKKHKLGEQIYEDYKNGDGLIKKKWMHQKKFERLENRYFQIDSQITSELYNRFSL